MCEGSVRSQTSGQKGVQHVAIPKKAAESWDSISRVELFDDVDGCNKENREVLRRIHLLGYDLEFSDASYLDSSEADSVGVAGPSSVEGTAKATEKGDTLRARQAQQIRNRKDISKASKRDRLLRTPF